MINQVYAYHSGSWIALAGKKVYHSGQWRYLSGDTKINHAGVWYPLAVEPVPTPYDHDQYGWYPQAVALTTYECTADETIDPDTGDPVYTNWRWQLISTETAERAAALENPAEYPQWRYYTLGPTQDFSVEVDTQTGHIIGYGADLHNPQAAAPPPPAAGIDYYMDTITVVTAVAAN